MQPNGNLKKKFISYMVNVNINVNHTSSSSSTNTNKQFRLILPLKKSILQLLFLLDKIPALLFDQ